MRQAKVMMTELKIKQSELQVLESNFYSLQAQAIAECPMLEHVTSALRFQNDLILSQAKEEYIKSISVSQQEEINNLNSFIKNSLEMLKSYYLRLKSQGIFTSSMFEEYNNLIKQARSSRAVTWEDEETIDCGDPNFKYLINLDLNTISIPEALIANILNVAIEQPDEVTIEDEISEPMNDDISASNSAELNLTYTEADAQSNILTKKSFPSNTVFPQSSIDSMILDLKNNPHSFKVPKSINPNSLNSTLVLSHKTESEEVKRFLKPHESKMVLSERTNTMSNEKCAFILFS